MDRLISIINFLAPYGTISYAIMFGILIGCGFGLPIPEDIILITGGVLSARGVCSLWVTNVVCMFGVLLGDLTMFFLGRAVGPSVKASWLFRRIFTERTDLKVQQIFEKYGQKVVFMGRFMPVLRTPIFLTAGIYRMSFWKFLFLDGTAALISVPAWIYFGYFFGSNLEVLQQKLEKVNASFRLGLLAVLVVAVMFLIYHFLKQRRTTIQGS